MAMAYHKEEAVILRPPRRIYAIFVLVILFLGKTLVDTSDIRQESCNAVTFGKKATVTRNGGGNYTAKRRRGGFPRFVFFMGMEGTGHHFVKTLGVASPVVKNLRQVGIYPNKTQELTKFLWKQAFDVMKNPHNISQAEEQLVELLDSINRRSVQRGRQEGKVKMIPLNILHHMLSYPWGLKGRDRQFPMLGLLFRACKKAGVDCGLVYIYRDIYEIVNSAYLHRRFYNKSQLQDTLCLYETLLSHISMQLLSHADNVLGCVGLFQGQEWFHFMTDLWGFQNNSVIEQLYQEPVSDIPQDMIPVALQPMMDLVEEANHRAIAICKDIVSRS